LSEFASYHSLFINLKYVTLENGFWLILYLLVMGGGLWGLHRARAWALELYEASSSDADEQQEAWQEWRNAAAEQAAGKGPVMRRVPKSDQPPTLVLLRDYYTMCNAALLVFGSVLFGTFLFLVRGMLTSPGKIRADRQPP
jgi:hypothetical protein